MSYIQNKLINGESVIFPDDFPDEGKNIPSHWVMEAIHRGVRVDVCNAIIYGPLSLKSAYIPESISFINTKFISPVDISFAVFNKRPEFTNCIFEADVNFVYTQFQFGLDISRSKFAQRALFEGINATSLINADSVVFNVAIFNRARIEALFSSDHAIYKGLVAFDGAQIADTSFINAHFEDSARFVGTLIKGDLNIRGAIAKKLAAFDGALIEGNAFLENAICHGEVRLVGTRISGTLSAKSANFFKTIILDNAKLSGGAFFDAAQFLDDAKFTGMNAS